MKNYLFALFFLVIACRAGAILAQPFQQGHVTLQLLDTSRNNRPVPVEVYYPALEAGEEVPLAPGQFPVLSFGHGFVMTVDAYANFSNALVPLGYIMAYSDTETGFSPSHSDLALDLSFIIRSFTNLNTDPASLFFGAVAPASAVMGHSMGGGASLLAAGNDPSVTAVVNFAAANTSPSAISACAGITIPALLFSGSEDCVTPPSQHQEIMFDSLASACKTLIRITGGGHCYFAEYNLLCTIGENSCSPNLSISREEQQDVVFDLMIPWLDHFLKGETGSFQVFLDSLAASSRFESEHDCDLTGVKEKKSGLMDMKLYPVPFLDRITVESDAGIASLDVYDFTGRKVYSSRFEVVQIHPVHLPALIAGIYQVVITSGDGRRSARKAIKI
jgi:pimeloyl-ACP methyl ester carboxylesterase